MGYRYEAYDQQGERVRGVVDVESTEAAEQFLWQKELTIVSLKRTGKAFRLHEQIPSVFGVRAGDTIALANQLAFLIEAGINMFAALKILRDQTTKPALKEVLSSVIDDIGRGENFTEACSHHPHAFPVFFVRILKVGEETGRTDVALRRVAAYMERRRSAAEKVIASLAYPVFVMIVAAISLYILVTVALPSLVGLFREFRAQMPLPTRLLMGGLAFLGEWGQELGLVLLLLGTALLIFSRFPGGKRRVDYALLSSPLIGPLLVKLNIARVADTMGSLVAGGIPLIETLDLLAETMQNRAVIEPLERVRTDILSGLSLSQSMARHSIFPPMMVSLLRVGEEAGTLEETLQTLGKLYNDEVDRSIGTLVGILEPALTVGVGLAIGFITITIISTVYSILPQVK